MLHKTLSLLGILAVVTPPVLFFGLHHQRAERGDATNAWMQTPPVTYPIDYLPGVTPPYPYGSRPVPPGGWVDPPHCPRYIADTPQPGWIRDLGPCQAHGGECQWPKG